MPTTPSTNKTTTTSDSLFSGSGSVGAMSIYSGQGTGAATGPSSYLTPFPSYQKREPKTRDQMADAIFSSKKLQSKTGTKDTKQTSSSSSSFGDIAVSIAR
ncbi:hypothetical protein CI109_105118 [Kwoniella shandongensis]|uniref:Uncharacterized protein n=1 Tax=Kwoniella shandongensis TaxID=1734106 RepID=A0A5M6C6U4_9TREE|nr:uncharacterized protein CI109_001957 [Kwoniella shandongensis]KAA5529532.1 hypothetical protein CI109_001957 [Kwoniella shandongensis]